jgi:hypothetical protein
MSCNHTDQELDMEICKATLVNGVIDLGEAYDALMLKANTCIVVDGTPYRLITRLTNIQNKIVNGVHHNFTSLTRFLGVLLCMDVGMGKTRTSLQIFKKIREERAIKPLLVIVGPSRTYESFRSTLAQEQLNVAPIEFDSREYEDGLFIGVSRISVAMRHGSKNGGNGFVESLSVALMDRVFQTIEPGVLRPIVLLVDEVHNAIKSNTIFHKFVRALTNHSSCIYRIFLTATPIVRDNDYSKMLQLMNMRLESCEIKCTTSLTENMTKQNVYNCKGFNIGVYWVMSRTPTFAQEVHKRYSVPISLESLKVIKDKQLKRSKAYLVQIFMYFKRVCISSTNFKSIANQFHVPYTIKPVEKTIWMTYDDSSYDIERVAVQQRIAKFYDRVFRACKDLSVTNFEKIFYAEPDLSTRNVKVLKTYVQILADFTTLHSDWLYKVRGRSSSGKRLNMWNHYLFNTNTFDQESKNIALQDQVLWKQLDKIVDDCVSKGELPIVIYEDRVKLGVDKIFSRLKQRYPAQSNSIALLSGSSCEVGNLKDNQLDSLYELDKNDKTRSPKLNHSKIIIELFKQCKIDILVFSNVLAEGLNIKTNLRFEDSVSYQIGRVTKDKMEYFVNSKAEFAKTTKLIHMCNPETKHMLHPIVSKGTTMYVSEYMNPVQHFINVSGSWDWKTIHQSIGRVMRNNSHSVNFQSDGVIHPVFPRGVVKVHNILLWNPYRCGNMPSSQIDRSILTYDEHTEMILLQKLRDTEHLTTALSALCVNCERCEGVELYDSVDRYSAEKIKSRCPVIGRDEKVQLIAGDAEVPVESMLF